MMKWPLSVANLLGKVEPFMDIVMEDVSMAT